MASWKRAKIGLLITQQVVQLPGQPAQTVSSIRDAERWIKELPELQLVADVQLHIIPSFATSEPAVWQKTLREIAKRSPDVDGMVVIDRPEAVPLTTTILDVMIESVGWPVVVMGYRPDSAHWRQSELINAIQIAIAPMSGVVAILNSMIVSARRIHGVFSDTMSDDQIMGRVDFGIRLFHLLAPRRKSEIRIRKNMAEDISVVSWVSDISLVRSHLKEVRTGVVLAGSPLVPIDRASVIALQKILDDDVAVVVCESVVHHAPKQWIVLPNVSPAIARIWMVGACGKNPGDWKDFIRQRVPRI